MYDLLHYRDLFNRHIKKHLQDKQVVYLFCGTDDGLLDQMVAQEKVRAIFLTDNQPVLQANPHSFSSLDYVTSYEDLESLLLSERYLDAFFAGSILQLDTMKVLDRDPDALRSNRELTDFVARKI